MRPSTSLRASGVRRGYLGLSEPPAYILESTDSGRVSSLVSQLGAGEGEGQRKQGDVNVHEVRADLGTRGLGTLDDLLGEGADVAVGRVESDSDDGLGGGEPERQLASRRYCFTDRRGGGGNEGSTPSLYVWLRNSHFVYYVLSEEKQLASNALFIYFTIA